MKLKNKKISIIFFNNPVNYPAFLNKEWLSSDRYNFKTFCATILQVFKIAVSLKTVKRTECWSLEAKEIFFPQLKKSQCV